MRLYTCAIHKHLVRASTILIIGAIAIAAGAEPKSVRTIAPFDSGWHFFKGDASGAEKPEFSDANWRVLSLPHDWSIEGAIDQQNRTGAAGGFLPAGVGWYRKHFTLPQQDARRRVFIDFDGVMANSAVWINGVPLGRRPYGYVSFEYELSAHLHYGDKNPNIVAVRADNSAQPASRWYSGAGIYRHVRLVITDPVHIDHWATFVTVPQLAHDKATVHVQTTIDNQSEAPRNAALDISITAPNGQVAATAATATQSIEPGKSSDFAADLIVNNPHLWNLDQPAMYRVIARVRTGKNTVDDEVIPFGIREFHFDPDTGFWLDGRNMKIKGVCLHHDGGCVGAAVPLSVWERRLSTLKSIGVNAIRTAHNPVAPEFLDLCDRMGFVVMDEMFDCWTVGKNPYDYHLYFREWSHTDTRDTVRRDRNHPSIVLYSAGNEIHDTPKPELAKEILRGLIDVFHANDPTRPVTQALFRPNVSHDYDDGLADMLDVIGQNYRENEILAAHAAKPARKIIGTENTHDRLAWLALRDHPAYAGQFLWSGIDYLGEGRMWPYIGAGSGLLDRTGAMKPIAYERQSWWSPRPIVYITRRVARRELPPTDPGYEAARRQSETIAPDWTPPVTEAHEENVEVYSNCDEVELQLNGRSLGSKSLPADASPRSWHVPFERGALKAIGRNGGQVVASEELRTAGPAAKVVLAADRDTVTPDWDDVSFVRATVVDENGTRVPNATNLIAFHIAGPANIVGVDNADNASHESFQGSERHAYHGECIAVVRGDGSSGQIVISASAPGLIGSSVNVRAGRRP